ncbi:carbamoyl-phosphate synthase L chain, ATP binding domain-containing protein [Umbelopsis sp. AD052]|nr:carbamoyl-phosphate synthase L chain, ATP binding domain-containing protein [Umbelopsis sp. AD052]
MFKQRLYTSFICISSQPIRVRPTVLRIATWKQQGYWYSTQLDRKPLFDKILIANRGEIACRVMRTAKDLGIKTVAVYSEADANAQHVKLADESYLIGPAASALSYLDTEKILAVAKQSGAQAIHPGYGFLSENADFADRVQRENLVFIGPPGSAMRSMGSKSESKYIMEDAGVPVVPGYHGENQDPKFLMEQAEKIGYPVLIKAIKGGGGKGMRIVNRPQDFLEMLESSKRESIKSFGDDKVLVEKYLVHPRHVEVQVFADTHGNTVHLFERDCSVQRRHQKVIEEAPAPGLSEEVRADLGAKAVAAAKAVGYVNAGTVEFIMDNLDKKFYFMEMNTRLQVEHPVTEMVTNTDLVRWQLEVASGNTLPLTQDQLRLTGHAFEARVYAENPNNNFLPDTGPLLRVHTPEVSKNVRLETGFIEGDEVSVHYDPMIAKLVVRGEDRNDALRILRRALDSYNIVGLNTNISFIKTLAEHPEFIKGEVETGFIQQYEKDLLHLAPQVDPNTLALAAHAIAVKEKAGQKVNPNDPFTPWSTLSQPFRVNGGTSRTITLHVNDSEFDVILDSEPHAYPKLSNIRIVDKKTKEEISQIRSDDPSIDEDGMLVATLDGRRYKVNAVVEGDNVDVFAESGRSTFTIPTPAYLTAGAADAVGTVKTPMPCKISQVLVKPGDKVEKDAPLIILEAMKMEHIIRSPFSGTIDQVLYALGDMVAENKSLVTFAGEKQ